MLLHKGLRVRDSVQSSALTSDLVWHFLQNPEILYYNSTVSSRFSLISFFLPPYFVASFPHVSLGCPCLFLSAYKNLVKCWRVAGCCSNIIPSCSDADGDCHIVVRQLLLPSLNIRSVRRSQARRIFFRYIRGKCIWWWFLLWKVIVVVCMTFWYIRVHRYSMLALGVIYLFGETMLVLLSANLQGSTRNSWKLETKVHTNMAVMSWLSVKGPGRKNCALWLKFAQIDLHAPYTPVSQYHIMYWRC
jgi:hypothetical protein